MNPLRNSLSGISYVWKTEPNFRWRVLFSFVVFAIAWFVHAQAVILIGLAVSLTMMLVAEIANTALELVCDELEPEFSPRIKAIKDMLSATVFVAALPALGILILVILPRLLGV